MARLLAPIFLLLFVSPLISQDELKLNFLGTYQTELLNRNAVTTMAYSPDRQHLFFVNEATNSVELLDIADPMSAVRLTTIELDDFGSLVKDLDFSGGLLAVATQALEDETAGSVLFFDQAGELLREIDLPFAPAKITFSGEGQRVLTANAGKPATGSDGDPPGSISIINMTGTLDSASATTITFANLAADAAYLQSIGVLIDTDSAAFVREVEPVAVHPVPGVDRAIVVLQKNNAYAIADTESEEIIEIFPFPVKDFNSGAATTAQVVLNKSALPWPVLGRPVFGSGQPLIELGGFSGLFLDPDKNGETNVFFTVSGRGPVGESVGKNEVDQANTPVDLRPFKLPEQGSWLTRFTIDRNSGEPGSVRQIALRRPFTSFDGSIVDTIPITGKANIIGYDEIPVTYADDQTPYRKQDFTIGDTAYMELPYDPYGADFGGVIRDTAGGFWMCDKYRPSIYHFDDTGLLIDRYVPIGSFQLGVIPLYPGIYGKETLPHNYSTRQTNGGFEALAYDPARHLLYAFLKVPLHNADSSTVRESRLIRILGIDPSTGRGVEEYVYFLNRSRTAGLQYEIGGAVYTGPGEFLVLENPLPLSAGGDKSVFEVSLSGAINMIDRPEARRAFDPNVPAPTLEMLTPDQFPELGLQPVSKREVANLSTLGYPAPARPEGISVFPDGSLAIINDNDYGSNGSDNLLTFLDFSDNFGLDANDRDNLVNIENYPIFGLAQPAEVKSFEQDGQMLLLAGNTGSPDPDTSLRVADVILDEEAFAAGDSLQKDGALGRLMISSRYGDPDGDGDFDRLYAYGGRSFSILQANGSVVFDSGDEFERITGIRYPQFFNSGHQPGDSFDSRSDDQGPAPGAVEVGSLAGKQFAFIGLQQFGGVMVYDITDAARPVFNDYINNRDLAADPASGEAGDLGVSDLLYINADESPTGNSLLVVGSNISGSVSFYGTGIVTSTSTVERREERWLLYPNPATDRIYSSEASDFQLLDIHGHNLGLYPGVQMIDVDHLVPGIYFLRDLRSEQVKPFAKGN